MPAVTVPPRPKGLPIAITHSPTRVVSLSPNFSAVSGEPASTLISATSVAVSRPITVAGSLAAIGQHHLDLVVSPTTWALVTM